ncbi:hypothetical protein N7E02_09455 [Aliirhizobium terrae]|uniref:hypothetical protein n=1 Tax=Terrirhizobium terrae TaxID=2926709 RepID=UPI002577D49D|nr:hypothetical protein [Rhizobium sp. CC-CFT758]WJH40788.1 hypothetical protein N7E02_09455 [Rhizobium sp. CC-CFT758]
MEQNSSAYILFRDDTARKSLLFASPIEIVVAQTVEEVIPALHKLEECRASGKWLAGYLAYEAGFAFEEKLIPLAPVGRDTPLVCMGVFDAPCDQESGVEYGKSPSGLPAISPTRGRRPVAISCLTLALAVLAG